MRLGIKAKQIVGVTAIVGLAVVALSALYVAAARARRAARERGARAAACRTPSFTAPVKSSSPATATRTPRCAATRDCARSSNRASTAKASPAPRSSTHSGVVRRRQRSDAGRQAALPSREDLASLINADPLDQLRVDLLARRPDARSAPADDARRPGVRLDSHRCVDGADAPGAGCVASSGASTSRSRRC